MFTSVGEALKYIRDHEIAMVDLKITSLTGQWLHVSIPARQFTEGYFEEGVGYDGSSGSGFGRVESGDVDWLMKRFTREKLRPEAADALVRIGGKEVAARIWRIIEQGGGESWIIQRSVYVLRRLTNLHVNYLESSRERLTPRQLRYIKDVLSFVYGKRFPE